jgi:hypothetical protein
MFCPNCKSEYRRDFSRCVDCGIDLVHKLSPEMSEVRETTQTLWEGTGEQDCMEHCLSLKDEKIHYEVSKTSIERLVGMQVVRKYEIAVAARDNEKARMTLGIEDDAPPVEELPAAEGPDAHGLVKSSSYLQRWYPEDATVEVWLQKAEDSSSIVELSLNANLMHFRSEPQDDGSRKFFVFPEDADRALEIVREIRDGVPPQ